MVINFRCIKPLKAFQIIAFLSSDPVTRNFPSGENFTLIIGCVCANNLKLYIYVKTFQIIAEQSLDPVAIISPSGEKQPEQISPMWPTKVFSIH